MTPVALSIVSGLTRSRLIPVVMIPSPKGLVRIRTSPTRAAALEITSSGRASPITTRPYLGSGSSIEWPPAMEMPASRALSAPPFRISARMSRGSFRMGKPIRLRATRGLTPLA